MATVIIGLTSYNRAAFLSQCIDSILNQTYKDFELLIIDDASTDNSRDVISHYAALDPRVKYIVHEKNWGRSGFYDLASKIDCKYLAVAHDDDLWAKDKLEKQVAFLEEHSEFGVCFTSVSYIDDKGNETEALNSVDPFVAEEKNRFQWLRFFFQNGNAFCHPSVLMRKDVVLNCDMHAYGFSSLPDMYIWIQVLMKYEIKVLPEKLTFFRVHDDGSNVSAADPKKLNKVYTEMFFVYELYRDLKDQNDLVRVFPEAKFYIEGKSYFCSDFILAMMALNLNTYDPCKLFGLKLLFDLIQDDNQREMLESVYGFGTKDFNKLKMEHAIFVTPQMGCSKLYYGIADNEFTEDNVEEYYFSPEYDENNTIIAKFNTMAIKGLTGRIRFDPVDNLSVSCRLIYSRIDDEDFKLDSKNAFTKLDDGSDVFLTLDPIYESQREVKFGEQIEIAFVVERVDQDSVAYKISKSLSPSLIGRFRKRR